MNKGLPVGGGKDMERRGTSARLGWGGKVALCVWGTGHLPFIMMPQGSVGEPQSPGPGRGQGCGWQGTAGPG